MKESVMTTRIPALVSALFVVFTVPAVAQQEFPVAAIIRGENIWLRIEPAEETEIVAYLQRGDQVRVTGEATAADGDAFYPVRVTETGETGWVRDLAIDPRSFATVASLPEVVIGEPPVEPEPSAPDRGNTRQRGENRQSGGALSFEGNGVDVTEEFPLEPGRYRVTASIQPDDSSNFVVNLIGPGDFEELLFNEIPDAGTVWEGETSVRITEAGDYAVQVDIAPSGPWTVQFEPM
jgi:hypothetical protein